MARRSNSRSTDSDDAIVVGVVRGPHGITGEVRVEPLTDRFDERFHVGSTLESVSGPVTIGAVLGEVHDVLRAGGADVLVVQGEKEILLPMLESVIREIGADTIVAVPQEEA